MDSTTDTKGSKLKQKINRIIFRIGTIATLATHGSAWDQQRALYWINEVRTKSNAQYPDA